MFQCCAGLSCCCFWNSDSERIFIELYSHLRLLIIYLEYLQFGSTVIGTSDSILFELEGRYVDLVIVIIVQASCCIVLTEQRRLRYLWKQSSSIESRQSTTTMICHFSYPLKIPIFAKKGMNLENSFVDPILYRYCALSSLVLYRPHSLWSPFSIF